MSWLPPLSLTFPAALPFGEFDILYYDGDLRVVKTAQGYYGVNVRVANEQALLQSYLSLSTP